MVAGAEITRVSPDKNNVRYRAYAKVNLALGVLGKRVDGYHEVLTVMAPVQVYDLVSVALDDLIVGSSGIRSGFRSIRLSCPAMPDLPVEKNLAYRAALAFMDAAGVSARISVSIDKRIPAGAGMGGGSSDAAAVLIALNGMVPGERALDIETLAALAARLGADVPFFLGCNSRPPIWEGALCSGIGADITGLTVPITWLVIALPEDAVQTREAYARWDELNPLDSLHNKRQISDKRLRAFQDALSLWAPVSIGEHIFNDLEEAVVEAHPGILDLKGRLLECGALGASMTGSGSAVFGVARSQSHAMELAERTRRAVSDLRVREVIVTRTGVDRDDG